MQNEHLLIRDSNRPAVSARIRVAIYARVSTSDGRQEVENQLSDLRQFAERQCWDIVSEFIDHESGSKSKRTAFRRMFADAAQRRFDLTLVWALDRLTREGVSKRLSTSNDSLRTVFSL